MQLGRHVTAHTGTCKQQVTRSARSAPPPAISPVRAPAQPCPRSSVAVNAKRTGGRSKTEEAASDDASGWDAALANIPTEDDEAAETVDVEASAVERTAGQAGDAGEPSTSYAPRGKVAGPRAPKPPSSLLSLAEYNMLMEARAIREAREEAERREREIAEGRGVPVTEVVPIEINRQGFQVFPIDGGDVELLVAQDGAGRLALADSYVGSKDPAAEGGWAYSRVGLEGQVPATAGVFTVIPWVERGGSDVFKRKAASNKVKKVYFINMAPADDGSGDAAFNLDAVFCFDGKSRTLGQHEVRLVGQQPLVEPVLRIRPSGLTLEESFLLPDPIEISMNTAVDELADMSEEELAERLAELEAQAEALDELDEAPDVPSVDNY
ncbi:hypothetical protein HYH02_003735 [Chlamydomonas schloesseri]|uniref:Uncharacterized protein n=1 Tax=Chlamydomonas schloesseri TaxID=2026947 RepID=A0A835WQD1_9CHLO|nr:hypothetical protein HYH02_003735 [Chlamydomonas schloesseri]|eukprot:KAG2451962.1 hypothetical protein HYH02_003735 [Chlamydomonas schloesseri]